MNTLIELVAAHARNCFSDGANDMDHPNTDKARAALIQGIEALQAENADLETRWAEWKDSLNSVMEQRNALQAEVERLKADYLEVERLCDATYVAKGADAYNHACEEMERFQEQRREAGKEVGTERSLCDGMAWLYKHVSNVEAERDALRAELDALKAQDPAAWLDLGKLKAGGMAYATAFQTTNAQTRLYAEAAPQVEQVEVERFKKALMTTTKIMEDREAERDALRAELDALKAQEPVGFLSQYNLEMLRQGYPQTIVMCKGEKRNMPLYAAPQAPALEQINAKRYRKLQRWMSSNVKEGWDIVEQIGAVAAWQGHVAMNSYLDALNDCDVGLSKAAPQAPSFPFVPWSKEAEMIESWAAPQAPEPERNYLQDIAACIGVGGYNGANDQQLYERICDEFSRATAPQAPAPAPLTDEACDRSYLNGLRAGYGYGLMEDHEAYLKSASNYKLAIEKAHEITGEAQG